MKESQPTLTETRETEPDFKVPIIDIVRHGQTNYKELTTPSFVFKSEIVRENLDPEHLDLTEEGIKEILEAAEQIEQRLDKQNEIVLLATSPNFRAQSSMLLIEKYLSEHGVTILNPENTLITQSLRQITFRDTSHDEWVKRHMEYIKDKPGFANLPTEEAHSQIVNEAFGQTIDEFCTENYDDINQRFDNFIRHMSNIQNWLSPDTKNLLKGKRLRVIALTHEELPARFMTQALEARENLKKGQVLEISPLESGSSDEQEIKVSLLKKTSGESESAEKIINKANK
jgi:broad specificity phosphatase PhoE